MNRLNKTLILLLSFILLFTITACDLNNQKQETAKPEESSQNQKITKPIKQEIPEYVMTKEVFKDETGEVYGTVKYDYDDKGNLLQVDYINKQGEVIERKKYKYNQYGLKIKRIVTKAVENNRDYWWRIKSHDRDMLAKEKLIPYCEVYKVGVAEYKYNSNGQLTYYEERNKEGKKIRWVKLKYYKNGNKKFQHEWRDTNYEEKKYFNQQGQLKKEVKENRDYIKKKKYFYDNSGNCVKEKEIKKKANNSEKIIDRIIRKIKYNSEGRKIKMTTRGNSIIGGTQVKVNLSAEYRYNHEGNITKIIYKDRQGDIDEIRKYKYDEQGSKTISLTKDGENNINSKIKYNYKYDNAGHILKVEAKNSKGNIIKNKEYYYKRLD